MLKIGLTGGIASGKTTISNLFSALGVPVIDTDIISRQLLEIDQPGYPEVVSHFGRKILLENKQIDRRQLRHLVFSDSSEKEWLEALLHPVIYDQTRQQIDEYKTEQYMIVVIPLLFETNFQSLIDRILVIDCSESTQIARLTSRDHIDTELAREIIAHQWSNRNRLKQADDVIKNNQNSSLEIQVNSLHKKFLTLS